MKTGSEFDDIRPYYAEEMHEVVERLLIDPQFESVINSVFPEMGWENFKTLFRSYKTPKELQKDFIRKQVFEFAGRASTSVTESGFDKENPEEAFTYISNHRDIVLDALILNAILLEKGYDATEVAIGDNLLIFPWIEDVVRMNNNFIVKRGASMHQMLENSKLLSKYIHYTITAKHNSIWIAQREGRAKDSNDRTQLSVLKMLAMGGEGTFVQNIEELNIMPVSLSYEFDPCDYLKAREFQLKRDNPEWKKAPMDDLTNMLTGLTGFKGRIHFQTGKPINHSLSQIDPDTNRNDAAEKIASLIDSEIFRNYRLFPVNFVAYDRLWGNGELRDRYSSDDEKEVDDYFAKQLNKIDLPNKDLPFLKEKIMEMYAWPVKNQFDLI